MKSGISVRECLRSGRGIYLRRPLPLILGWSIAAGIVVLFVFLLPTNLSGGLHLGAMVAAPALLWAQRSAWRSLESEAADEKPEWASWRNWSSASLTSALLVTLFRYSTFWIWMAVPLSGGLMYTLHAWGVADMYMAGRLDLLIGAIVFGPVGFFISCGLLFAPLCAAVDGKGPFDAIRRSWRMAGSQRLKILGLAAACLWMPVALFLTAYVISVLRNARAVFAGVPAVLWSSSLIAIVLLGPWFTSALTALFIPLKAEEDEYVLRREERRTTSRFDTSPPRV
ncbi:hypothetical protein ACFLSW_01270 [Candidatus Bipolaricaulota bacterium]